MQCETKTQHLDSKTATELEQHISACLSQLYKCSYFLQSFVQLLSVPRILSYILWYNMYSIWVSPPWHWFGPLFFLLRFSSLFYPALNVSLHLTSPLWSWLSSSTSVANPLHTYNPSKPTRLSTYSHSHIDILSSCVYFGRVTDWLLRRPELWRRGEVGRRRVGGTWQARGVERTREGRYWVGSELL